MIDSIQKVIGYFIKIKLLKSSHQVFLNFGAPKSSQQFGFVVQQ